MASVDAFQAALRAAGVWTSVRAARGDEESSACGQLATKHRRDAARRGSDRSDGRGKDDRGGGSSAARVRVGGVRAAVAEQTARLLADTAVAQYR